LEVLYREGFEGLGFEGLKAIGSEVMGLTV